MTTSVDTARTESESTKGPADKDSSLSVSRELFRGRAGTAIGISILTLLSVGSTLALPLVVARMIDAVTRGEPLLGIALTTVTLGLGAAVCGAIATNLLSRLGEQLIYSLRVRVIERSLRMRIADLERIGSGDIATRLTADALQLKAAIDIVPVQMPIAGITLVGTLVIMGIMDWVLLLITMAGFVLALAIVAVVIMALKSKYLALQRDLGAMTQKFMLALEAVTVIKSTRSESSQTAQLAADARKLRTTGVETARLEALMVPAINLGQQIALLTVLIGGGARLVNGDISLATFVGFLLYLLQLTAPLILASTGISTVQAGLVAKSRFTEIFALPVESEFVTDKAAVRPVTSETVTPAVEFDSVSATYGTGSALRDVSFTVPPRGLTSVVGPSGAGKSTILKVIEQFVQSESGTVRVFGDAVDTLDLEDLRTAVGYVDQEFTLVADSVRTNLELGLDRRLTDDQLYDALAAVGMDLDVRAMPDGLDTVLTAGRSLSGGQCQRLALARAIVSDARLILLDEPTSALDAANENKLRDVIASIAQTRAVLVVAHRISTVRDARHVIVMDQGTVRASGTHVDLLDRCDLYAELVEFQLVKPTSSTFVGA